MSTIDSMKGSHGQMQDMMNDLRAMLTEEQLKIRPNAMTTHRLLCELADKLKTHMTSQDQNVYPGLLIHEDPKLKSMAWGFLNGQKPMRKQYEDYYNKWLKNCDFQFTKEFIGETLEIFDMIDERIEREKLILIPTLESSGVFSRVAAG